MNRLERLHERIMSFFAPRSLKSLVEAAESAKELADLPEEDIPPQFRNGGWFSMQDVYAHRADRARDITPRSVPITEVPKLPNTGE